MNIDLTTQHALAAANALSELKGRDIIVIEMADVSSIADYFVIATGDGHVHIKALADKVRETMANLSETISHTEGFESKNWVLLDYYSIVVHLFTPDARDYYGLETLWGDAKSLPLEDGKLSKVG